MNWIKAIGSLITDNTIYPIKKSCRLIALLGIFLFLIFFWASTHSVSDTTYNITKTEMFRIVLLLWWLITSLIYKVCLIIGANVRFLGWISLGGWISWWSFSIYFLGNKLSSTKITTYQYSPFYMMIFAIILIILVAIDTISLEPIAYYFKKEKAVQKLSEKP